MTERPIPPATEPNRRQAIEHALAANDIAAAATLAEAALAAGEVGTMLLNLAAWRREEAGDFAGAEALLQRALALAPRDATIVAAIGAVRRKQDRLDEALLLFDAAARLDPAFAVPWLERGYALAAGGSLRLARDSYARAAELDPLCAPAFAGIAAVAAQLGDAAAARLAATRALALDAGNATATLALGELDIEHGAAERAAASARALIRRADLTPENRVAALTLAGDALDRLDACGQAFAAYTEAQALAGAAYAARVGPTRSHRALVEWLTASVAPATPRTVARLENEVANHVFLIGYPRSGTTLVENVLASAEGVEALEERPTLAAADRAFLADDAGLGRLAALDTAGDAADGETTRLRAAYWDKVAAAGITAAARTFVDMDPLKGIKLPVIARLFPNAKIVVMHRDPRDVVWSCFRRNFRLSPATFEFTSLDRTARHYDAVMRLTERCLEMYPLAVHRLRYDALVADFDTTTAALCAATGVPWSAAMRRFDATARRRGVSTASVGQVRRGLYDGGGQWRRYAAQLAPVMPLLTPWVERFGFAP